MSKDFSKSISCRMLLVLFTLLVVNLKETTAWGIPEIKNGRQQVEKTKKVNSKLFADNCDAVEFRQNAGHNISLRDCTSFDACLRFA